MLFFAETFQPMNAAVTFQIGLNDSARAIRGKFTFADAWESFQGIRTVYNVFLSAHRGGGGGGRSECWFRREASK